MQAVPAKASSVLLPAQPAATASIGLGTAPHPPLPLAITHTCLSSIILRCKEPMQVSSSYHPLRPPGSHLRPESTHLGHTILQNLIIHGGVRHLRRPPITGQLGQRSEPPRPKGPLPDGPRGVSPEEPAGRSTARAAATEQPSQSDARPASDGTTMHVFCAICNPRQQEQSKGMRTRTAAPARPAE